MSHDRIEAAWWADSLWGRQAYYSAWECACALFVASLFSFRGAVLGFVVLPLVARTIFLATHRRGYAPCPTCGRESLAAVVDHICEDCADRYVYCIQCNLPEFEGHDGT